MHKIKITPRGVDPREQQRQKTIERMQRNTLTQARVGNIDHPLQGMRPVDELIAEQESIIDAVLKRDPLGREKESKEAVAQALNELKRYEQSLSSHIDSPKYNEIKKELEDHRENPADLFKDKQLSSEEIISVQAFARAYQYRAQVYGVVRDFYTPGRKGSFALSEMQGYVVYLAHAQEDAHTAQILQDWIDKVTRSPAPAKEVEAMQAEVQPPKTPKPKKISAKTLVAQGLKACAAGNYDEGKGMLLGAITKNTGFQAEIFEGLYKQRQAQTPETMARVNKALAEIISHFTIEQKQQWRALKSGATVAAEAVVGASVQPSEQAGPGGTQKGTSSATKTAAKEEAAPASIVTEETETGDDGKGWFTVDSRGKAVVQPEVPRVAENVGKAVEAKEAEGIPDSAPSVTVPDSAPVVNALSEEEYPALPKPDAVTAVAIPKMKRGKRGKTAAARDEAPAASIVAQQEAVKELLPSPVGPQEPVAAEHETQKASDAVDEVPPVVQRAVQAPVVSMPEVKEAGNPPSGAVKVQQQVAPLPVYGAAAIAPSPLVYDASRVNGQGVHYFYQPQMINVQALLARNAFLEQQNFYMAQVLAADNTRSFLRGLLDGTVHSSEAKQCRGIFHGGNPDQKFLVSAYYLLNNNALDRAEARFFHNRIFGTTNTILMSDPSRQPTADEVSLLKGMANTPADMSKHEERRKNFYDSYIAPRYAEVVVQPQGYVGKVNRQGGGWAK